MMSGRRTSWPHKGAARRLTPITEGYADCSVIVVFVTLISNAREKKRERMQEGTVT
jgi:hypothetical protein